MKKLIAVIVIVSLATPAAAGLPGFDLGRGFRLDVGNVQVGGGGITKDPVGQFLLGIDLLVFSYANMAWTVFEAQMGLREDGWHSAVIDSKICYALPLDQKGYHRLQFGVGLGVGMVSGEPTGFVAVPYVRYQWALSIGVEAILPVSSDSKGSYVAAIMAYVGLSLEMLFRR
jgi:hypothetical protein